MSIQPKGEELRKAVKWISAERQDNSNQSPRKLVSAACLKFNLSPKEAAYLERFVKGETAE